MVGTGNDIIMTEYSCKVNHPLDEATSIDRDLVISPNCLLRPTAADRDVLLNVGYQG